MFLPLSNVPREYGWGSETLIAEFEGREPSGAREAEIWFGDHPGSPAMTGDGRTLDVWLSEEGARVGAPPQLPYLLKLLAAGSSLSIQAHPSKTEAMTGFAKEEAAGISREAPERTYRDGNHKPELIVALSDTFTALAGLRDRDQTLRLLAELGEGGAALSHRLSGPDAAAALRESIAWLLSGDATAEIAAIVSAAVRKRADASEFTNELALIARLNQTHPGDPGVGVALLMNLVTLRRGEGLFVPAGVLHAYQAGLGVEIMAASDNVLRGGLTPKHIDVEELMGVLDTTPGPVPVLRPEVAYGVSRFEPDVSDFALAHVRVDAAQERSVAISGTAIVLGVGGAVTVAGESSATVYSLVPGAALLVTPSEGAVRFTGDGEVFLAQPGKF